MKSHDQSVLEACASHVVGATRLVVGTTASAAYTAPLIDLSRSAQRVGFRCLVVQASSWMDGFADAPLRFLSLPDKALLPRPMWCNASAVVVDRLPINIQRFGWRRSHLYRTRLWRVVLEQGHSLLSVDLDYDFLDMRGQPLQPPGALYSALQTARTSDGREPDVIAMHDGPNRRLLNVGLMFLRATPALLAVTRRVENRSVSGWEQGIFNEEISYGSSELGTEGVACCYPKHGSGCDLSAYSRQLDLVHFLGHQRKLISLRQRTEGDPNCSSDQPSALEPPAGTAYRWSHARQGAGMQVDARTLRSGWRGSGDAYNVPTQRPLVRCTAMSNVCNCGRLVAASFDDALRTQNAARLSRYIVSKGNGVTVRGKAFRLGMTTYGKRSPAPAAAVHLPPSPPELAEAPILLRDWLQPFVPWKEWHQIMSAPTTRVSL